MEGKKGEGEKLKSKKTNHLEIFLRALSNAPFFLNF
jgi:hypothetical protein